ncbi:metallophosphoesterase [Parafrigoribacterium soli]|uniref:metallophosphoesterase n=1 Tax=Parafrigoribacterium soli TaxID=3144663 RepID=UPI0032F05E68
MPASTPLRILHISDTHLFGDDSLHYGRVDTFAALARALDQFSGIGGLDLLVASGDLSDDGSPRSYQRLRSALAPWAAARGASVIYAMGNHDDRRSFRQVLGSGHEPDAAVATQGPIDAVSTLGSWRVVTIDTSVPGAGYGELGRSQLDWLGDVLSEPAEAGTVLVMHHPPVPASTALLQALELYNPEDLLEVIRGSDVRVILSGHYHHALSETFGGVPVIVAPGIANATDVLAREGTERAVVGSGAGLVTVGGDDVRSIPLRSYGQHDGEQIFHLDLETVAQFVQEAGRVDTR